MVIFGRLNQHSVGLLSNALNNYLHDSLALALRLLNSFIPNSTKNLISTAHKYSNAENNIFSRLRLSDIVFVLLINVKMASSVGKQDQVHAFLG